MVDLLSVIALVLAGPSGGSAASGVDRALLRAMVANRELMARHVDRDRGVALIVHHLDPTGRDPRADGFGRVRVAARLCGDRLDTELRALRRTLAERLPRAPKDGGLTCTLLQCSFGPGPASAGQVRAGRLLFVRKDARLLLDAVVMQQPDVSPAAAAGAEKWITKRLESLKSQRCVR